MRRNIYLLIFILLLFGLALWAITPLDREVLGREGFKLGLDLKGGSHLIYQADLTKKDPEQTEAEVMESVKNKIERRVNAYGVTEPISRQFGANWVTLFWSSFRG